MIPQAGFKEIPQEFFLLDAVLLAGPAENHERANSRADQRENDRAHIDDGPHDVSLGAEKVVRLGAENPRVSDHKDDGKNHERGGQNLQSHRAESSRTAWPKDG